jgi:hypothetical protein
MTRHHRPVRCPQERLRAAASCEKRALLCGSESVPVADKASQRMERLRATAKGTDLQLCCTCMKHRSDGVLAFAGDAGDAANGIGRSGTPHGAALCRGCAHRSGQTSEADRKQPSPYSLMQSATNAPVFSWQHPGHPAAHSNKQQRTAAHSSAQRHPTAPSGTQQRNSSAQRHPAAHSGTQRRTAAHSSAQRRTAAHSGAQRHPAAHRITQRPQPPHPKDHR